jgi:hypothetical protein
MPSVAPETRELFVKIHVNTATSEDFVEWAVSLLEAGIFTKSVGILSSLGHPLYPSEVEDYFNRSLKELGWSVPEREGCLREYARDAATKILRDEITPSEGCERIYQAFLNLDFTADLAHWSCLYMRHAPEANYEDLSDEEFDACVRREAKLLLG